MRWTNNYKIADGWAVDGPAIAKSLEYPYGYDKVEILKVNSDSVFVSLTGKMSGTYGMSTKNTFKKIK